MRRTNAKLIRVTLPIPAVAGNSPLSFDKFSIISKENVIVWRLGRKTIIFLLGIFPITIEQH